MIWSWLVALAILLAACGPAPRAGTVVVTVAREPDPIPPECRAASRLPFAQVAVEKDGPTPYDNLEHAHITNKSRWARNGVIARRCECLLEAGRTADGTMPPNCRRTTS